MTAKDAYMFPVMGSIVLFSLYLLFKFLDKDLVNMLLTLCTLLTSSLSHSLTLNVSYFLVFGFFALSCLS